MTEWRPPPSEQGPHRGLARRATGWLNRLIASGAFIPAAVSVGLVCVVGTSVEVALLFGWTPPRLLPRVRHDIVITGPGVDQPASDVTAYIVGAVVQPGVYTLPATALVQDLVRAAGGLLPDADAARVDLASHVVDGQEVYVPRIGEVVPPDFAGRVNLNTASADDLHAKLGISLDFARRIVAYRTTHGPFTAVSQLLLVPISRTTYDRIKYLVFI